jgi:hypothetical protein
MRSFFKFTPGAVIAVVLLAVLLLSVFGQPTSAQEPQKPKGLPPRANAAEYQAHAQAGSFTIGAEFAGHSIPDPQSALTTEDFVVVEVGLFGPPEARLKLSNDDFSVRLNGKKTLLPAQGYVSVFRSLKDPEWEPPVKAEPKTKTNVNGGGQSEAGAPPPVVHIPIEVERAMQQRVQKAALPEGDRALPAAGLLFFEKSGKTNSIELIYSGPAGKVTIPLRP